MTNLKCITVICALAWLAGVVSVAPVENKLGASASENAVGTSGNAQSASGNAQSAGERAAGGVSTADLANFRSAAKYSRSHNGEATVVLANGNIIFESYYNGYSGANAHDLASGTKSFWGVAAVACEADGMLRLDDYVSSTITEWKSGGQKSRITIRQLLNQTSGLEPGLTALDGPKVGNKYAAACSSPLVAAPGERFAYGAANLFVFGELLKRKLHRDPVRYLRTRIFTPCGIQTGWWRADRAGNSSMPAGCGMTARNWATFGWLLLNQGKFGAKTIVPAAALRKCRVGSKANPAYGLGFWLTSADPFGDGAAPDQRRQRSRFEAPADTYTAAGAGNQRLYIIPDRGLVVVHFGKEGAFRSDAFLAALLAGRTL